MHAKFDINYKFLTILFYVKKLSTSINIYIYNILYWYNRYIESVKNFTFIDKYNYNDKF